MIWILGAALAVAVTAILLKRFLGSEQQPVMPITTRIQQAADIEACERLAGEIVAERSKQIVVLFAELFERRAKVAQSGQDLEAGIATILWSSFGASQGDGYRIVPEARADGDGLAPWRAAPAGLFAHLWSTASAATFPATPRALLLQALWELRTVWASVGGLPSPFEIVRAAVTAHIEAAIWALGLPVDGPTRGMEAAKHWKTAQRLALEVGQIGWVGGFIDQLRDGQQQILAEAPHWSFALIEAEVDLAAPRRRRAPDVVSDARLEELLPALDDIVARLRAMSHMDHVEREVIGLRARVEALLGRGPDQKELARRRGEHHERLARNAQSGLQASMHWKAAAEQYMTVGLREDGSRAKANARSALRRAEEQGEFQEIQVPIRLSEDGIESILSAFFEGADRGGVVLGRMAARLFAPSLEAGVPASDGSSSLARQLLVTVPLVDDRALAGVVPGTDEHAQLEERRALLHEIQVSSAIVLSELFSKLRRDLHLHQDDILERLVASPVVEVDDLPFLRIAAERYLRGDLVSAMHVLVPRVEQLVRRLLQAAGSDVTASRDGDLREKPLGELLRTGEADGTLGRPLVRLLQAVLSEDWGLNLRNRVAHGLLKPGDCNQANVDRVLHIALHLAALRPSQQLGDDREEQHSG